MTDSLHHLLSAWFEISRQSSLVSFQKSEKIFSGDQRTVAIEIGASMRGLSALFSGNENETVTRDGV